MAPVHPFSGIAEAWAFPALEDHRLHQPGGNAVAALRFHAPSQLVWVPRATISADANGLWILRAVPPAPDIPLLYDKVRGHAPFHYALTAQWTHPLKDGTEWIRWHAWDVTLCSAKPWIPMDPNDGDGLVFAGARLMQTVSTPAEGTGSFSEEEADTAPWQPPER